MTPRRTSPVRVLSAGLFAALLLVGGACSSSGGDETSSATTTTADDGKGSSVATTTREKGSTTTTEASSGSDKPSETAEGKAYVDALVKSFGLSETDPFTEDQVECTMKTLVDDLGIERFTDNDLTPENIGSNESDPADLKLTQAETERFMDNMQGCGMDLRAAIVQGLAEEDGKELTDAQKACIDAAVSEEDARRVYSLVLRGRYDDAQADPIMSTAETCIS